MTAEERGEREGLEAERLEAEAERERKEEQARRVAVQAEFNSCNAATVAGFAHPAGVEDRTLYMTVLTVLGAFLSFASIFLNKESWSVWKPNFRRPCLRDCVCVMAWWFTKITRLTG